jgi:hypothetical protein
MNFHKEGAANAGPLVFETLSRSPRPSQLVPQTPARGAAWAFAI